MYKDTYLRNDADLNPFLQQWEKHSRGSVPGSLSAALNMLSQGWSSSQARSGTLEMLQGWNISRVQERRSWPVMPGDRALSPYGISVEQHMHNCWKRKGRRRMDWAGSPFSCSWARDWLPSLGKHHSHVELACGAGMRAARVWCCRFGAAPCWVRTIELLRK